MRSRWKNPLTVAILVILAAIFALTAGAKGPPETFGIANATSPEPGVLLAGQPTGEQVQLLAEDGYKTILDLRLPDEPRGFDEVEAARQNGLAYVSLPVDPAKLDQATIDRFLAAMKKAQRPVLLHCGTAARAGALWYAWLVLEKGKPPAAALAAAKTAGLRSPELRERIEKLVAERKRARP
ncbi:MAG TPA: sulfur transferase domain-containing protein [Thermoanaerobaculia bacterium]|nr:sulfur transferase domain-containing protein [Thermoanaerobaculia bacterium]